MLGAFYLDINYKSKKLRLRQDIISKNPSFAIEKMSFLCYNSLSVRNFLRGIYRSWFAITFLTLSAIRR